MELEIDVERWYLVHCDECGYYGDGHRAYSDSEAKQTKKEANNAADRHKAWHIEVRA